MVQPEEQKPAERRVCRCLLSTFVLAYFGNQGLVSGDPLPRHSSFEKGVIGAPPPLVRDSDYRFTAAEVERLLAVREKEVQYQYMNSTVVVHESVAVRHIFQYTRHLV